MMDLDADLDLIRQAAIDAGALAIAEREAGLKIESKVGGSPVTSGDLKVDALLRERLLGARPDYGWLSEETADSPERRSKRRIFVVDPIDGTVAYMKRTPWWCVPIAVVEDGQAVAAVIHAPVVGETYVATRGGGAMRNGETIAASDVDTLEDLDRWNSSTPSK
jgi:myo-inositol-1(or 4)-monophosphatase